MKRCLLLLLVSSACFSQQYEVGADLGYGIYRDGTIFASGSTSEAGVRNRFAAGILLGDELTKYIWAEFHYLYQDGHPFLDVAGTRVDIQGQSLRRSRPTCYFISQAARTSLAPVSRWRRWRQGLRDCRP